MHGKMATASLPTSEVIRASAAPGPGRWSIASAGTVVGIGTVALAYVAASRLGLALDAVGGFAALVWPGSGIALAALLIGGYRLWPAITIGAFITNIAAGAPILVALAIAGGNTAEAVLGVYLLRKVPGFNASLTRVRDMVALIILSAGLSTTVSATIGVTSLATAGIVPTSLFGYTWRAWWLGDAIGILLVGTLILGWSAWTPRRPRALRAAESIALGVTVVAAALIVFGIDEPAGGITRGREYMLFPPLIWAALRFGLRGAVSATVGITAIAIFQTSIGRGPFVRPELHESLLALQTFMGILGGTITLLGASISERRRAARELHSAREKAEAANRAKANFLGVVSHELRTPLNAITGYVDMLSMGLDGPLTEKQHRIIGRIVHSQRHLLSLIEDVLSFAQSEAGRLSFALQPVAVDAALSSVEAVVAPEVARKNLKLQISDSEPGLMTMADPDKLRQILLNLVTNAIKFTPEGVIDITTVPTDDKVRITIKDSGIGIAKENLQRVFDPFYQVDQGGTRRFPGVGLGLSIVRDSVLAMGGDITIDSIPGDGTQVHVTLPRAHTEIPASA